ncbi:MAG: DUF3592 domain-containing protein [Rhodothermales bacterium]|nr:DUF3592 domain-containing protein [Rhodothermales bacterium]
MKQSVNPKLLLTATLFLAVVASAVGVLGLSERQYLLTQGVKTTGVVVGIDVGVKGIRSVEARFTTLEGLTIVGRDVHKTQWFNANERGDWVTLHYDPQEPEKILLHRGFWMWSNPAFMLAGGAFLCGLGLFLYQHATAKDKS